jgi:hypothetical protein
MSDFFILAMLLGIVLLVQTKYTYRSSVMRRIMCTRGGGEATEATGNSATDPVKMITENAMNVVYISETELSTKVIELLLLIKEAETAEEALHIMEDVSF